MNIAITLAGRKLHFHLARLNYAGAQVLVRQGAPPLHIVAGGTVLPRRVAEAKPGQIVTLGFFQRLGQKLAARFGIDRQIWVFPPEWTAALPDSIDFVAGSDPAHGTLVATISGIGGLALAPDATLADAATWCAPFPPSVVNQVNRLAETVFDPSLLWDDETMTRFIAELARQRLTVRRLGYAGPLARYLGYLQRMDSHMKFALRHFPDINTTAMRPGRYHAIATNTEEMMVMAHHLYVLRDAGVGGDFAEFGSFKGFSTACLSRAAAELSLTMHVFDSFEGLPPSKSGRYLTGEYAGSFEEVRHHVRDFGAEKAIVWHRGFFTETVPGFATPLAALWMDVDLKESAGTVMTVLPLLEARGCIFSHELNAAAFIDGVPNREALAAGRFEVLSPIIAAVEARAGTVRGEHLVSSLGAIYLTGSIPVLPSRHVQALLALAQ